AARHPLGRAGQALPASQPRQTGPDARKKSATPCPAAARPWLPGCRPSPALAAGAGPSKKRRRRLACRHPRGACCKVGIAHRRVWGTMKLPMVVAALAMLAAVAARAEHRVALIIGNGAYANVAKLPNTTRDAEAMEATFPRRWL